MNLFEIIPINPIELSVLAATLFFLSCGIVVIPHIYKILKARKKWQFIQKAEDLYQGRTLLSASWAVAAAEVSNTLKKLYMILAIAAAINLCFSIASIGLEGSWIAILLAGAVLFFTIYNAKRSNLKERKERLALEGYSQELAITGEVTIEKLYEIAQKRPIETTTTSK